MQAEAETFRLQSEIFQTNFMLNSKWNWCFAMLVFHFSCGQVQGLGSSSIILKAQGAFWISAL